MTQEQLVQFGFIILPFVLTGVLVPLIKLIITKLPASQQAHALQYVQQAVNAVEQLATSNTANIPSASKKALAQQFATTLLKNAGFTVDAQVISTLIESAVFLLNQKTTVAAVPITITPRQAAPTTASAQPQNASTVASTAVSSSVYDVTQVTSQTGVIPTVSTS